MGLQWHDDQLRSKHRERLQDYYEKRFQEMASGPHYNVEPIEESGLAKVRLAADKIWWLFFESHYVRQVEPGKTEDIRSYRDLEEWKGYPHGSWF